jgi:hypothetical protein
MNIPLIKHNYYSSASFNSIKLKKIYPNILIRISIIILLIIVIFDPADKILSIKVPVFVLLLLIYIISRKQIKIKKSHFSIILFIIFFIIPYSMTIGLIRNSDINYEFSYAIVKSFLFLILLPFLCIDYIYFVKILYNVLLALALAIILLFFIIFVFSNIGIYRLIAISLVNYLNYIAQAAKIGIRNYGSLVLPMIYYKTSSLLIIFVALAYMKKKKFHFWIGIIAIFLSGTRANILAIIMLIFYKIYHSSQKFLKVIVILIFILILIASIPFAKETFFNTLEPSNIIKTAHFISYISLFNYDPLSLIIGQGLGAEFYSVGVNGKVAQTELVYLDLLRYFGFPILISFILFLIYPLKKIFSISPYLAISYAIYLIVAGTNPLLISSTGMIVIIFAYSSANYIDEMHKRNCKYIE